MKYPPSKSDSSNQNLKAAKKCRTLSLNNIKIVTNKPTQTTVYVIMEAIQCFQTPLCSSSPSQCACITHLPLSLLLFIIIACPSHNSLIYHQERKDKHQRNQSNWQNHCENSKDSTKIRDLEDGLLRIDSEAIGSIPADNKSVSAINGDAN